MTTHAEIVKALEAARVALADKGEGPDIGHGHVWKRRDGMKMRCGGPGLCKDCSRDLAGIRATKMEILTQIDAVLKALASPAEAAGVAEGFVLVPREPTSEIIKAYIAADRRRKRFAASAKRDWNAMLEAAAPGAHPR